LHTWCGLSANLGCMSEMCCMRLAENTGCKTSPKIRHLGVIAQLCRAISSQQRHVSTIGKKLVKQQYLLHMYPQYGELGPLAAEIGPVVWGPQLISTGFVSWQHGTPVVGVSQTAALNRGRHQYSAGRPSRWTLAYILVLNK